MLKTLKFYINEHKTKEGKLFTKATIKGEFLPTASAEPEAYYTIKFTSKGVQLPQASGFYEVAYESKGLWIDSRSDYAEKHIVRINAVRVVKL